MAKRYEVQIVIKETTEEKVPINYNEPAYTASNTMEVLDTKFVAYTPEVIKNQVVALVDGLL